MKKIAILLIILAMVIGGFYAYTQIASKLYSLLWPGSVVEEDKEVEKELACV